MNLDMALMYVLVAVVEFVLSEVNQDPVHGGINPVIGVKNSVGCLGRTVFRHDANNNFRGASTF